VAKTFKRIDIGFEGGQVLSLRVESDAYEALSKALAKGSSDRWHELESQDAEVSIDLSKIVYLRVDTEEQRVGF
jgi:hypothetical protein